MKSKIIISTTVGLAAILLATTAVMAQVNSTTGSGARVLKNRTANQTQKQALLQTRTQNLQNRGDTQTTNRINALNKLLTRIQGMKNLTVAEKTAFSSTIQTSVTSMTNLQAKIQSDTSTTSLQADLKTIAPDYRIYMLIMPQISILSAVDRVNTLVASLQTIQNKIQTRVSGNAGLSSNTTISSDLSDMTAKLSDASNQANAAESEVVNLQPDQGNQTTMQSNNAALKDAQSKMKTAAQELITVRKDAGAIVKLIVSSNKNSGISTSTTAQ